MAEEEQRIASDEVARELISAEKWFLNSQSWLFPAEATFSFAQRNGRIFDPTYASRRSYASVSRDHTDNKSDQFSPMQTSQNKHL